MKGSLNRFRLERRVGEDTHRLLCARCGMQTYLDTDGWTGTVYEFDAGTGRIHECDYNAVRRRRYRQKRLLEKILAYNGGDERKG